MEDSLKSVKGKKAFQVNVLMGLLEAGFLTKEDFQKILDGMERAEEIDRNKKDLKDLLKVTKDDV